MLERVARQKAQGKDATKKVGLASKKKLKEGGATPPAILSHGACVAGHYSAHALPVTRASNISGIIQKCGITGSHPSNWHMFRERSMDAA